ncbi:MAG: HU family DNA-binding protein [Deltaproteobacteria bacterium]|nr:HU family DNA-binding protein [Deltaproteobacteria bacterium]
MTVTKEMIVKRIVEDTGLTTQVANNLVDKLILEMKESLQKGQDVLITGFGKFIVNTKQSRLGRNPKTNAILPLRARKVVIFKTSLKLRKILNE